MGSRTIRLKFRVIAGLGWVFALLVLAAPAAWADALYTIRDLGTLPGTSMSVATGINNQGQVVGISYNNSDGSFGSGPIGSAAPSRFHSTGNGAQSFLFNNGQMTRINPTGGLAMAINDAGQTVGGSASSINQTGQYVSGPYSGIDTGSYSGLGHLSGNGSTINLPALFSPYTINNAGQIAGYLIVNAHGGTDGHPAVYQGGQVTDLFSKIGNGQYVDSRAIAINQRGDLIINSIQEWSPLHSYYYNASNGRAVDLTSLPGGAGLVAAALNDNGLVVGNGFLFNANDKTLQALKDLLSSNNGWSNLNATQVNDAGQIVGQGLINGQEHGFLMTPNVVNLNPVPEPSTLAFWGLVSAGFGIHAFARRRKIRGRKQDKP